MQSLIRLRDGLPVIAIIPRFLRFGDMLITVGSAEGVVLLKLRSVRFLYQSLLGRSGATGAREEKLDETSS